MSLLDAIQKNEGYISNPRIYIQVPTQFSRNRVQRFAFWWRWRESNPRPLPCGGSALPTELHPHAAYTEHKRVCAYVWMCTNPLELSTLYILTGTNGSVNNCTYMPKKSIEHHLGQDMCCYRWYLEHLAYHPQFAHTSKGKLTLIDKTYLCLMHS